MRTQPKVKMYIEIKQGQEEKIRRISYPRQWVELQIEGKSIRFGVPSRNSELFKTTLEVHGLNPFFYTVQGKPSYIQVRGHKITKLGKHELVIPVRGHTLDDVLKEVQETENELQKMKIRYERKCTWVCGM